MRHSFLLILCLNSVLLSAQSIAINTIKLDKKIDSLFQSYNNKNSPGFAITVIQNEKVITKKTVGMASIEFGVPFSHNTVVTITYSEGREFISIGAALMEQDGILTLKDKIREYFPKLPAWSEAVTIQDLLNHSSGFCDEWATLVLTQASMGNRLDGSQFMDLLYNQPVPEVEPGKGYMYSNSDFGLLRLILEKASGENLDTYLNRKVFTPLGMTSTEMRNNKEDVITNHAFSYYGVPGKNRVWLSDKTSPGGNYHILTSANDLEKWAAAHNDPGSSISKAVLRLKQNARPIPVLPGTDYVFGQKLKQIGKHETIVHEGVSGWRYLSRVPDARLSIVCLGNYLGGYAEKITELLEGILKVEKTATATVQKFPTSALPTQHADLLKFEGTYRRIKQLSFQSNVESKIYEEYKVAGDNLYLYFSSTDSVALLKVSDNIFKDPEYPAWLVFSQASDSAMEITIYSQGDNPETFHYKKVTTTKTTYSKEQLQKLTGNYYSKHLDFYWRIEMNEAGNLVVKRPTISDKILVPGYGDEFKLIIQFWPDDESNAWIRFYYDDVGKPTHFDVNNGRLMNHRFDKVDVIIH